MPVTRKIGFAPLRLPSEVGELAATLAATSTAKASDAPGPHHVRVKRGAGVASVIRSASPMPLAAKP